MKVVYDLQNSNNHNILRKFLNLNEKILENILSRKENLYHKITFIMEIEYKTLRFHDFTLKFKHDSVSYIFYLFCLYRILHNQWSHQIWI